jgi:fumarate reductase flavoprotein subunit
MVNPAKQNADNLQADIVVIGGGGAGLTAAVVAAKRGAKVILLEKRRKLGGTSAMAQGLFGAESIAQKRLKIDAQRDELFRMAMKFARWSINPRIVRAFIDKSGDTIRWLEEKGLTFDVQPYYPNQAPMTWHRIKEKGAGAKLIELLAKESKELGVRWLCETAAKELITNEAGNVVGVLATRKGEKISITASSAIIATGGYGGNKRLLRKYCPYYHENIDLIGIPNTGDGLLMALKVGAATEGLGIIQAEAAFHVSGGPRELMACSMEPDAIWVNRRGERYMDESVTTHFDVFESAQAVIRQPDSISYTILDERMIQRVIESGPNKVYGPESWGPGVPQPDLPKALQLGVERGGVKISSSWDGIAVWMGASPAILKATLDEYNSFCDNGYDAVFAKERRYLMALRTPPYYALKCHPVFIGTIGGIKINHHMEVLDHGDNPIPGLYAVGVDAGGWEPDTYNAALSGSTFGFAINSGRIAGENAAKFVLRK